MKGYLQRVAASALNPSRAIHPVLAPVYMAARFEAEPVSTITAEPEAPHLAPAIEPGKPERRAAARQPERVAFQPLVPPSAVPVAGDPPRDVEPSRTPPVQIRTILQTEMLTEAQTSEDASLPIVPAAWARQPRESRVRAVLAPRSAPQPADEIQIHIGRIEVTAVPPAAAPAIRKPAHRSLNLDDYLKRGR